MKRTSTTTPSEQEPEQQRRRLLYDRACRLIVSGSPAEAVPLLRSQNDASAQALLASVLLNNPGIGGAGEVVSLVRSSAAAENPHSMCFQATMDLLTGIGDPAASVERIRRAAQLGSSEAVRQLGLMHLSGDHGVPPDSRRGLHLIALADSMGNHLAARDSGRMVALP